MEQGQGQVFKPHPSHLYPVILSLAITGVLGYPLAEVQVVPVTIFPETPAGASLNAILFVLALGGSATAMFLLVRKGRIRMIREMVKGALLLVSFIVAFWYGTLLYLVLGEPLAEPFGTGFLFGASIITALALGALIFRRGQIRQLLGVTLASALTGLFLGASIPLLTSLVLAGALVVYDIMAVFKGPIGALAKSLEMSDLTGAVFSYRELTIGMGDMVFYSLVATTALRHFGVLSFLATGLGILLGTFLGFKALQKFEMFPGLPFSLVLGVGGMLLVAGLQGF